MPRILRFEVQLRTRYRLRRPWSHSNQTRVPSRSKANLRSSTAPVSSSAILPIYRQFRASFTSDNVPPAGHNNTNMSLPAQIRGRSITSRLTLCEITRFRRSVSTGWDRLSQQIVHGDDVGTANISRDPCLGCPRDLSRTGLTSFISFEYRRIRIVESERRSMMSCRSKQSCDFELLSSTLALPFSFNVLGCTMAVASGNESSETILRFKFGETIVYCRSY